MKFCFNTVLDQPRVFTQFVLDVVVNLINAHDQHVCCLGVSDAPNLGDSHIGLIFLGLVGGEGTRRAHPVERFVGTTVRVNQQGTVLLEHQHTCGQGQVCTESTGIVNGAFGNNETHEN